MSGVAKITCAAAVSLLLHALLALGIAAYLEYGPGPKALAELDVSSVELSFSEEEADEAEALCSAAVAAREAPEKPKIPEAPETPKTPESPEAPDIPAPPLLPEPPETPEKMVTPPRREAPSESAAEGSAGQPAPAARQARIDAPPRQKSSIRPDYPKGARQRGEQGDVVLAIAIG